MSTYPDPPIVGEEWIVHAADMAEHLNLNPGNRDTWAWTFSQYDKQMPAWLQRYDTGVSGSAWYALHGVPTEPGPFTITPRQYSGGVKFERAVTLEVLTEAPAPEPEPEPEPEGPMSNYPEPATVGQPYTVTAAAVAEDLGLDPAGYPHMAAADLSWPSWLSGSNGVESATGTPTEAGTVDMVVGWWERGSMLAPESFYLTIQEGAPPVTIIAPPAAMETADGYRLPAAEGVRWLVNGTEQPAGDYSMEPVTEPVTLTIVPEALAGYAFDPAPVPLVLTFTPDPGTDPDPDPDPDPEPDPDPDPEPEPEQPAPGPSPAPGPFDPTPAPPAPSPEDEAAWAALMDDDPQALYVASKLGQRIIRHTGSGDPADLEPSEVLMAQDHAMVVLEYVRGYTRGRGFVGYAPHRALQAVIVAAGSRLFTNPEQLTSYQTGDYSERPAILNGWTMAELGVLRRFRRTYR